MKELKEYNRTCIYEDEMIDNLISKVNEIIRYINDESVKYINNATVDDIKTTSCNWEQMYKDLCIDYRQVCKEKTELKENYEKLFKELTISETALNDVCMSLDDLSNRDTEYALKIVRELRHDKRSWVELKNNFKTYAQDSLKEMGTIK